MDEEQMKELFPESYDIDMCNEVKLSIFKIEE